MSENVTIGIILGSSRQPRLGDRVCTFVLSKAQEVAGATFTVLDLANYKMPFFDEEIAPLQRSPDAGRDRMPCDPVLLRHPARREHRRPRAADDLEQAGHVPDAEEPPARVRGPVAR
jgi:NADPH-dependent FMN reductase